MPGLYSWRGGTKPITVCRMARSKSCQLWRSGGARCSAWGVGHLVEPYGGLSGFAEAMLGCEAFAQMSLRQSER